MNTYRTWMMTAMMVVAMAQSTEGQTQITATAPVGGGPQFWVDMNPDVAGIQVARVVEPGMFEIDVVAFNIADIPATPISAIHFWIHYNETVVRLLEVVPPLLGGFGTDAGVCNPPSNPPICAGVSIPNASRVIVIVPDPPGCVNPPGPCGTFICARLVFETLGPSGQTGFEIGPGFPGPPNTTTFYRWPIDPCAAGPFPSGASIVHAKSRIVVDAAGTLTCLNVNSTGDAAASPNNVSHFNPDTSMMPLGIDTVTLRSAIQVANALSGENRITFLIPGGPTTIATTGLPNLSDTSGGTEIDGSTQPGTLITHLTPGGAESLGGPPPPLIGIVSADNEIRDLTVNGNTAGAGIAITGPGASNNEIRGCKIGTNVTATERIPNSDGILIANGASNNRIGGDELGSGNIISGNSSAGVWIDGTADPAGTTGNLIRGNYIGTDVSGTFPLFNVSGIDVTAANGNFIGSGDPEDGNLISGNIAAGIFINGERSDTHVRGNYIGPDSTGTTGLGQMLGITISESPDNVIGGPSPDEGNLISTNSGGIAIDGAASTGNIVMQNLIGTTPGGDAALGNAFTGVLISSGAAGNVIGMTGAGNVISGNNNGVSINGANGNIVQNNFIGTNSTGTAAIPNLTYGVIIFSGSLDNVIGQVGAGNLISGNGNVGVAIFDSSSNSVQANIIGLNAMQTAAVPNQYGVAIDSPNNVCSANDIGGTAESLGNIISGNTLTGVNIKGSASDFNIVEYNIIGANQSGSPFPNTDGVDLFDGAHDNAVRNNEIIFNSEDGILVVLPGTDNNQIVSNTIGTVFAPNGHSGIWIYNGPTGTAVTNNTIRGNGNEGVKIEFSDGNALTDNSIELNSFNGVTLLEKSSANYIGIKEHGNVIANNGADGVRILFSAPANFLIDNIIHDNLENGVRIAGAGIHLERNSIFDNDLLGIDLLPDGLSLNDADDSDSGGNGLQNFPVLELAGPVKGGTLVIGAINSAASTIFTIEIFANPACDPSKHGEGKMFLGAFEVETDRSGDADFEVTVGPLPRGAAFLTATATDPGHNTSEFSACLPIGGASPCPADIVPSLGDGQVNVDDLLLVINSWGDCKNPNDCPADINGDNTVNVDDLLAVINAWGPCE